MKQEEVNFQRIQQALEFIKDHATEQPHLETVAAHVHLSPYHFQRMFEQWAGISPKKFLQYLTLQHARKKLAEGATVLEAAYSAGLSGSGRIHDLFVNLMAVSPGEYKKQGENLTIGYGFHTSPFGEFLMAYTEKGICNLVFIDSRDEALESLQLDWPNATLQEAPSRWDTHLQPLFYSRDLPDGTIDLHLKGSPFQVTGVGSLAQNSSAAVGCLWGYRSNDRET